MPADFEISPLITPVPERPVESVPPVMQAPHEPPFRQSEAGIPPMRKRSNQLLKWLMLAAAGLFVLTIGSLWWGGSSFSDKGVSITLDAPDRATSGDEITYTISYRNDTKVSLTDMSFRLFYPEGTIVMKDGAATMPESEGFTVDKLDPGQSGTREIKAVLVGDKGAMQTARVKTIFRAGTLRSNFEKEATVTTTITALPVTLTLVAPPTVVAGQPVEYLLDMRNDSGADLSDLKVTLAYPDGFVVQSMNPNPSTGNTVWNLDALADGQGKRIRVTGTLPGAQGETKIVTAVVQRNLNGQYVDYVRTEAFTMISSPLLSVSLAPAGGRDYVAFPGDTLRYTVTYRNDSRFTLLGLLLGVKLEGDMYDTARVQVSQGFFDDASRTIVFDAAGVPDFSALTPGTTGRLTFTVPLKAGLSGGQLDGAKSFFVKATARLATSQVPTGIDGNEVFALDSVTTKIGSQPTLTQALVYDGGAGSGPLPPVAGQDTTVMVRWQLANPGNDVRDAKVVASLPTGVIFAGTPTASNGTPPVYDRTRNTVTWTIGTLPFGTGNGTPRYEATFKLSFKPSESQRGQSVPLMNRATLTGTDVFTGQLVESILRNLTSDDIEGHPNDGRVQ
ncbi:MAG: hypothetical protein IT405_02600 [Candidatus Yanofskybacteria bacterium]|nr:hypothetical protein [Candidatus Yanofskybacteria bacterium]